MKICMDDSWPAQKARIVEDLLATETTYLVDLTSWESVSFWNFKYVEIEKSLGIFVNFFENFFGKIF